VVDAGTLDELLERQPRLAAMWDAQSAAEERRSVRRLRTA